MTCVLSVDLASGNYRDLGVALLDAAGPTVRASIIPPVHHGRPTVTELCTWLVSLANTHEVAGICIDGPLGWKAPDTDALHSRLSERAVRAPGKTGLPPDGVKPRTYLAFTQFSIALFEALTQQHGFSLPGSDRHTARFVTETFPTAAWRSLGLAPLPAKSKTTPARLDEATARFAGATGLVLNETLTHDALQAVVGGVAGLRWAQGQHQAVHLAGAPPFRLDGSWREGYIMLPAFA